MTSVFTVSNDVPTAFSLKLVVDAAAGTSTLTAAAGLNTVSGSIATGRATPTPGFVQYGGRIYRGTEVEFMRGTINHLMFCTGAYTDGALSALYYSGQSGILDEWFRLRDLLIFVGWAGSTSLDDGLSGLLRPAWEDDADANNLLAATAENASGVLFVGPAGEVLYHNRRRRMGVPARWTLSEWADGLAFPLDAAYVINDVTAERSSGVSRRVKDPTSIAKFGLKDKRIVRDVADDGELTQAAGWVLHRYRESSPRCDQVVIDGSALNGADDGPLVALAHGAQVGDKILFAGLPDSAPAPQMTFFVEGVKTSIEIDGSRTRYRTMLQISDASRSSAWILEDEATGHLDSDSCVLIY